MNSIQQYIMDQIDMIVKKHATASDMILTRTQYSNTGTLYIMNGTHQIFMTIRYDFQYEDAAFYFNEGSNKPFKVNLDFKYTADWNYFFKTLDHQLSEENKRVLVYPQRR